MTLSHSIDDQLCQKLRMVGLTKDEALSIVNLLSRQIRAEGPENVVRRLKVLMQAAINKVAGLPDAEKSLTWIKHTPKGPKGPWRSVWMRLTSKSIHKRNTALNALKVYSSVVLPKRERPTRAQERKFIDSVVQKPNVVHQYACRKLANSSLFQEALRELSKRVGSREALYEEPFSDVVVYALQRYGSDARGVRKTENSLNRFLGSNWGREFQPFPEVQRALGHWGRAYRDLVHPWHGFDKPWTEAEIPTEAIGVIGSSQEPGFKFRAFAAPNIVLQAALEPLKRFLLKILERLPHDNTHDQERGVLEVQQWLRDGKTVYSVDLSDATNNFPLDLQLRVLSSLKVPPSTIRLMEMIARSPYKVMWKDEDVNISWTKGQPLGAGPSFMMFALTHGALVRSIELGLGKSGTFQILGDDFVCCDSEVHEKYRHTLMLLGCPISEAKCITSDVLAEFAGKLIMADNVFHGYKYKEMSDLSFMSVVRTLGKRSLSKKFLNRGQYEYAKAFETVPTPWGLGFNPKGEKFEVRYERYLRLQEMLQEQMRPLQKRSVESLWNDFLFHATSDQWKAVPVDSTFRDDWETFTVTDHDLPTPVLGDTRFADDFIANLNITKGLVVSRAEDGDPRKKQFNLDLSKSKVLRIYSKVLEMERQLGFHPDACEGQVEEDASHEGFLSQPG